ncbi:hypothetical protein M501DRAFT_836698 [Patellaria atrata CBS 101060]|uniref:Zn(2)-C6 fungal-type domain-containing protein n=1 Tax=Patellaria atrata CBS 101060 TaxID=1346257 RepID=A0A9P4VMM1_9PEZI|nr:hypothetical protein M501DRAFT_836698 [Patellaria atrata CBS 101060]
MPVETVLCPDSKDLMVLETPLLRVSRPVAACSRCRSAKVKCDGKLPACTACERAGKASECSSTNDQFAKGKERSYVATLESRVEKLERKLAEARARRKSSVTMPDAESTAPSRRPSANLLSGKPVDKRAARRREAHDIDDLVSDFGLLAVNATARDFYGFTSEMSYARLILSACSKEPLPTGMTKVLPPRYAATPLIQHYLNTAFAILPFFEESSFYASVDAVYSSDPSKASPFDHWCVRMVLAIATLALSEQRGDTHYCDAVGHLNAALEHSEAVLHPGFISGIQATLLLVEYALLDPHHFDSWSLIGAASRAMVDLGMHQDPSRSSSITKSKLELRRRVYWCVYALDRSTSLVQTRAFSFSDDSANVGIPFSSKSTSVSKGEPKGSQAWLQSFDSAVDLFHLRQLQSEWYTTLFQTGRTPWQDPYPYIWRTYENMTAWSDKASPRTSKGIRTMFELELLYSYVYILSPSPRCPVISKYAQRLIFEHCISYASKMFKLTTEARGQQSPVTFYDAMRAYMTGRQFVDVVARNQDTLLSGLPPTPPATSPAAVGGAGSAVPVLDEHAAA